MTDEDWEMLLFTIRTGNCILLLGPEVSTDVVQGQRKTRTSILANQLADKLGRTDILDRDNLAHVAQLYASAVSKTDLKLTTAQFYRQSAAQPNPVYAELANLPFGLIVSATHDDAMEKALGGQKPFSMDWYSFKGDRKDIVPSYSQDRPLVYHLYGSVQEPQSLVISENDLLDFLVAIISKTPALPSNISSEFRSPDKCFLFLGFGFRQWYLRILLHVLQEDKRNSRSFAFEEIAAQDDSSLQHAIVYYKEKYKLGVYAMEPGAFVIELGRRYQAQPADASVSAYVPTEDQPTVFICHANEDKEYAGRLSAELKQHGMRPWLDREALEGGDRWDELIRRTIRRQVDYFVVLQSRTMDRKTIGYLNREIELAIDRQKEYRFPARFIIPAKIEECEGLEELADLQQVDLRTPAGVTDLVRIIRRDRQRRQRDPGVMSA
ncbi:MAG: toll/interleukin-1 receptor domain-containing protein [Longimicrobiaceae bacterium]